MLNAQSKGINWFNFCVDNFVLYDGAFSKFIIGLLGFFNDLWLLTL